MFQETEQGEIDFFDIKVLIVFYFQLVFFLTQVLANKKPAITVILKLNSFLGDNFIILSRHYHYGERSVAKDYVAKKCDSLDNHTIHTTETPGFKQFTLKNTTLKSIIAAIQFIIIILSVVVHVLHTTWNLVVSRCCFAEEGKKMHQDWTFSAI